MSTRIDISKYLNSGLGKAMFALSSEATAKLEPKLFELVKTRASQINEEMKLAAAQAIAGTISDDELGPEYIVPSVFDRRITDAVAQAVKAAAHRTGVSRRREN